MNIVLACNSFSFLCYSVQFRGELVFFNHGVSQSSTELFNNNHSYLA